MLFGFLKISILPDENDWEAREEGFRGSDTTGLNRSKLHIPWEFNLSQELIKDLERWLCLWKEENIIRYES